METYKQRREAKRAEQDPGRESAGAEASPKEMPVPEKAPQAVTHGSKAASPMESTHQGERDLETVLGIVERIHALCLQILREMGGMRGGLWGHGGAPAQPAVPGPSHIGGPVETEGDKPLEQEAIDLDAIIPAFTSEDAAAIIISDDEVPSFPGGWPEAVSTPKIEEAWGHKRPLEDTSPCSSPPKKWATEEMEESLPPCEPALPRGMTEKDILPKRYEVFTLDYDWVQSVRGSLLGLEAGALPSTRDINNSSHFVPRTAASETDLPEVITEHWLPILRRQGLLVECPLDQFTALVDWIPLYTRESLQKYLPAALSAFPSQGVLSLIAIAPPEFCVGMDKEFLLCNFHHHPCLMRQSFNLEGRCRQLAFCPYCGVINENSDMALSHVRKHLDLQFVCGGCFSRSFLNGPALNKHMKAQCASVTTIRDRSKPSRW